MLTLCIYQIDLLHTACVTDSDVTWAAVSNRVTGRIEAKKRSTLGESFSLQLPSIMACTDASDFAQEQEQLAGQRCVSAEHIAGHTRGGGGTAGWQTHRPLSVRRFRRSQHVAIVFSASMHYPRWLWFILAELLQSVFGC